MKSISYKNTVITDGFWKIKQDMIKDVTLESVYNRFKETHRFDALDCSWKEGDPDCPHVFWDSDIAKWLEGLAYILAHSENEKLEKIADESIEKIEKNRDENGYYNSHFLVTGEKFTIRNEHELYCAGHLMEAAVAYYEATGKKLLLDIMCKYADYIEKAFVKEKTAKFVTPGHPEIELALVKMYEVTGEKRYLDLSKFFVDNHGDNNVDGLVYNGCRITYNQDECAVRDRETAEGHCVRALYLFCAMADIAYYYDDKELFAAAERCFENIVNKRMYITGATGSTCHGESFTIDYDLPNRDAYAETCASIALCMFANRMIKLNPDGKYGDAVERALYNGVLSGISMDGKSFFYENPLTIDPDFNNVNTCTDGGKRFPITQRKEVFDCSCCPPNVIRLIADIGDYMYSYNDDTVFVHQYINSETSQDGINIKQETKYPANGDVIITVNAKTQKQLAFRVPYWCKNFTVNKAYKIKKGYAYVDISGEEKIIISFDMTPKFIKANKRVHDDAGRVALMRGPVVYCLEGKDNGKDLECVRVDINSSFKLSDCEFILPALETVGYQEKESDMLYFEATDEYDRIPLKFIPYYAYANRGETELLVWILKK
ncbi:MAG: glycoside hydrolase family 127 protein [Clostridia bacterium]|nr:glycoside hydrolase family 127 protein [Clostridia bacterium]